MGGAGIFQIVSSVARRDTGRRFWHDDIHIAQDLVVPRSLLIRTSDKNLLRTLRHEVVVLPYRTTSHHAVALPNTTGPLHEASKAK